MFYLNVEAVNTHRDRPLVSHLRLFVSAGLCCYSTTQLYDCYRFCDFIWFGSRLISQNNCLGHACSLPLLPHATLDGIFSTAPLPVHLLLLLLFSTRYELPSAQRSLVTNRFTSICFPPRWIVKFRLLWSNHFTHPWLVLRGWTVCFRSKYIVEGWSFQWWRTWNVSSHLIIQSGPFEQWPNF